MGEPTAHPQALRLLAAFSGHTAALDWARQRAVEAWGPVALESPAMAFADTDYYEPTMGSDLKKIFFVFEKPFDPGELADVKLLTNQWEREYAEGGGWPERRPLNLDPGYLTLGKLVLASTKDHAHRIYLDRGIYAEVTLHYSHHRWRPREWTFADYRREEYHRYFTQCRDHLHRLQKERTGP